jgi:hypothetical protein
LKLTIEIVRFNRKGGAQSRWTMMEGSVHEHKFKIGQSVSFTFGPFGRGGTNGIYKVTSLLPPEGDDHSTALKMLINRTSGSSRKASWIAFRDRGTAAPGCREGEIMTLDAPAADLSKSLGRMCESIPRFVKGHLTISHGDRMRPASVPKQVSGRKSVPKTAQKQ